MHEVFPGRADDADAERAYAEVVFDLLPAGAYHVRVVVSYGADGNHAAGEEREQVWREDVFFSVEASEAAMLDDAGGGATAASTDAPRDDGSGIGFDFPPNMHHFKEGESVHVTFRIDRDFGDESSAHIYLGGVFVASSATPKGTVVMDNIPFDDDVVYNVTLAIMEGGQATARAASILFTSAEKKPQDISVCMFDPANCVSRHDFAPAPPPGPGPPQEARRGQGDVGAGGAATGRDQVGWGRVLALHELPRMRAGQVSKHASSNAPLHSMPDFSNFLRAEAGELVLMDDFGPGCVYRIFMPVVMGPHQSGPRWRFRVRIDGDLKIDEAMGAMAELGSPPFIHPVAGFGDLKMGFYSMVPMVFRKRMVVSVQPPAPLQAQQLLDDSVYCLTHETRCACKVYWDIDYTRLARPPADPPFELDATRELLEALALFEFSALARESVRGGGEAEVDRCEQACWGAGGACRQRPRDTSACEHVDGHLASCCVLGLRARACASV